MRMKALESSGTWAKSSGSIGNPVTRNREKKREQVVMGETTRERGS